MTVPRKSHALLVLVLALSACRKDPAPNDAARDRERARDIKRRYEEARRKEAARREAIPERAEPAAPGFGGGGAAPPPSASAEARGPKATVEAPRDLPFVEDEPVVVGPPAPATATELGVLVNDKEGRLFVLRLGARPGNPHAARTPLPDLPEGTGPFGIGPGPAFWQDAAYWISHGSLVRRKLDASGSPGALEVLARDAHDGTRVAVPVSTTRTALPRIPATVAYVLRPEKDDAPLIAKLWVEGAASQSLTAEGNSTHSVGLVRVADGVLALSVQARMAITPVHARRVRYVSGKPELGDDLVAWVGGGIQPLTEMALLPDGRSDLWGFVPHERSIREFGLARLDLGLEPDMETPTSWTVYPNGIDPAPVSAAHVCGRPMVLYAAPETARPDSGHVLLLRHARDAWESGAAIPLATDRVIYFVSIAEAPFGAVVVWVTDRASRAVTLRCTRAPR